MDPLLQLPETIPEQQQTLHDGAAQSGSLGPGSEQLPTTLGAWVTLSKLPCSRGCWGLPGAWGSPSAIWLPTFPGIVSISGWCLWPGTSLTRDSHLISKGSLINWFLTSGKWKDGRLLKHDVYVVQRVAGGENCVRWALRSKSSFLPQLISLVGAWIWISVLHSLSTYTVPETVTSEPSETTGKG